MRFRRLRIWSGPATRPVKSRAGGEHLIVIGESLNAVQARIVRRIVRHVANLPAVTPVIRFRSWSVTQFKRIHANVISGGRFRLTLRMSRPIFAGLRIEISERRPQARVNGSAIPAELLISECWSGL